MKSLTACLFCLAMLVSHMAHRISSPSSMPTASSMRKKYVQQVELWREALGKLPAEVAHAVAHRNAERLWKLAPAMAGQGCGALKLPLRQ